MTKSEIVRLRCTPQDRAALAALAQRRQASASEIIRGLIQQEAHRLGVVIMAPAGGDPLDCQQAEGA